jgi:glutamate racemase
MHANIRIIDPSVALVNNFNNSFLISKSSSCESTSNDNIKFFVTQNSEDFSKKVKYWLEINKEIKLVNLRSND